MERLSRVFIISFVLIVMSMIPAGMDGLWFANARGEAIFESGWEDGQEPGLPNQVLYSKDVANPRCSRQALQDSHNGGYGLMVTGESRAAYAYSYHKVFDLNIPVGNGMKIGYWIYHVEGTGKIAVDGQFTDGNTLRDFGGKLLKDQNGIPIHPAYRQDPMDQWVYVEVDLSATAGKTLDYIMFAFDNGNDGFKGQYLAYVDDFKIFEAPSTPLSPVSPASCSPIPDCIETNIPATSWKAEYYSGKFGCKLMVNNEGTADSINQDWGTGGPNTCGIGSDNFSVRWTRTVYFSGGTYEFTSRADDGVKVWVDKDTRPDPVINAWYDQGETPHSGTATLTAGNHIITMEYYENGGDAVAKLSWQLTNPSNPCINSVPADHWKGEYYNNRNFIPTGQYGYVMSRDDGAGFLDSTTLSWPWSGGSNGCVANTELSVRWTRDVPFTQGGNYIFTSTADDGIRVWVDSVQIINDWQPQSAHTVNSSAIPLTAGTHHIVVEYFQAGGAAVAKLSWQLTNPSNPCINSVPADHWKGEYYNNRNFIPTGQYGYVMSRDDGAGFLDSTTLSWPWSGGSNGCVANTELSVRWTRDVPFTQGGNYIFTSTADDGIRVWVDSVQIINDWQPQSAHTVNSSAIPLTAGTHHIVVEYFQAGGAAVAMLSWQPTIVPPSINPRVGSATVPSVIYRNTDATVTSSYSAGTQVSDLKELRLLISTNLAVEPNEFQGMVKRETTGELRAYLHTEQIGYHFYGDGNIDGGIGTLIGVGAPRHDSKVIRNQWSQFNVGESYVEVSADQKTITVYWSFQVLYAAGFQTAFSCVVDVQGGVDTVSSGHVAYGYHNKGSLETKNPTACLAGVPSGNWRADYFNNLSLTPPIMMTLDEGNTDSINHNWFNGSPGSSCGLGTTNFSIRWTRTKAFDGGNYEFSVRADDGVRLWVDKDSGSNPIIDQWQDYSGSPLLPEYKTTVSIPAGNHTLTMEYYQRDGSASVQLSWRQVAGSSVRFSSNDPYNVTITPADDNWYRYDLKTPEENRNDIAQLFGEFNRSAKARAVREHLSGGGRVVLLVNGLGNWGGSPAEWGRPIITYANDFLEAVVIQVNYSNFPQGIPDLPSIYLNSFNKGVDHVYQMVQKARKAGSENIRIYGHSEGSDITARVVAIMVSPASIQVPQGWNGQGNPPWFEGGFAFGNPADQCVPGTGFCLTSAAAPPQDAEGKRKGFYRYTGQYKGYFYNDKLVIFNRASDYAPNGTFIYDSLHIGTSAHNYQGVFSYPDFMAEFETTRDPSSRRGNVGPGQGFGDGAYVNRQAGVDFDFTNVHFVPFIPALGWGLDTMSESALTIVNFPPNALPIASETAHVVVKYYDANGNPNDEPSFDLGENVSNELSNRLTQGGSAIIRSSEQLAVTVDYNFDKSSMYYGAAYPSESYPSRTLYVPFLTKGRAYELNGWHETTEIVLFNPSNLDGNVDITYYNGTPGTAYGEARNSYTIRAHGSQRIPSVNLPAAWNSGTGVLASAVIHANVPLSGMVRNRIGNVDVQTGEVYKQYAESNYRAFATRGKNKMFAPLLKVSGSDNYRSSIIVQNTSDADVSFYFDFYQAGASGGVSSPGIYTLAPKTMKMYSLADYNLGNFSGNAVLHLTSDSSQGTVALVSQVVSIQGAEANEGIPDGIQWYQKRKDGVIIPFLPNQNQTGSPDWHSEFSVINQEVAQNDYVHIDYHDPINGTVSRTVSNRLVSTESSIHFEGNNDLPSPDSAAVFSGSAAVLGTNLKHLGATVQINRWGKRGVTYHDILMGYSAWW